MTKDQLAKANMIQTKIESISQTRKTINGLLSSHPGQSSTPKLYFKLESPREPVFLDIPEVLTYKILDITLSSMTSDLEKLEAEFKKI